MTPENIHTFKVWLRAFVVLFLTIFTPYGLIKLLSGAFLHEYVGLFQASVLGAAVTAVMIASSDETKP
jgi:hypothetical protein